MSEVDFGAAEFKAKTKAAVQAIEASASAEVLVTMRRSSGGYRDADFLFGFLLALALLLVMLFVEHEFSLAAFPAQCALAFVLGTFVCSRVPVLRRTFTTPKRRAAAVHAHARAAFVDLGLSRTHHRRAVLVYVSMLEREVEVVVDSGLDALAHEEPWKKAVSALDAALSPPDSARFLEALSALGPLLAARFPHEATDANELPDDVAEESEAT